MATQVSDTGTKTRARGSSDELAVIAQRAQAFTGASGTAIALSEGNTDEIVCRARSGASAPEVGTTLRVQGSFTGLCIQSGKELRCDDAETDTRVDTSAIRALGIRSMVVTPIREENKVVGVLAVFAPTAHAFTITHVAVLKTMADQISSLLQKERRLKEEGVQPEPMRPAAPAPVPTPKPVAVAAAAAAAPAPVVPPVVIKPAVQAPAPAPRAAFPVVSKIEPIKPTPVAEEIATPAVLPRKEEKRSEQRYVEHRSFGTFDAVSEEKKSGNVKMLAGVAVVLVIAGVSTFAYFKTRKPASPAPIAHSPEVSSPAVTGQPGASAPLTATNPTTQPSAAAASPQPAATNSSTRPAENTSSESARKPERVQAKNVPPPPTPPQPEKHAPETVALSNAPSRIARTGADSPVQSPDAALAIPAGTPASGALSALATSMGSSNKPSMLAQSNLEPVQVLKRVPPVYPIIARQRRLSGNVTVEAMVGKDGKVSDLQLISGPPIFRDAAFDAVRQWQFKPATLNGQPIEQKTQIKVAFNP